MMTNENQTESSTTTITTTEPPEQPNTMETPPSQTKEEEEEEEQRVDVDAGSKGSSNLTTEEEEKEEDRTSVFLPSKIDPFAPREGHLLEWRNLNLETPASYSSKRSSSTNTNNKSTKTDTDTNTNNTNNNNGCILHKVSGSAKPGQLTCIMGASGSGKTTLLQILGGKPLQGHNSKLLSGDIYLDGQKIDPTSQRLQKKIAYIAQSDKLLPTATPREAIRFAARLRLPRSVTDAEINKLTTRILEELRLTKVADSLIGGDSAMGGKKYLSGGEMRRVSLGVQLVVVPRMLFLDEITSGLDSRNAAVVMDVCKNVAAAGTTMMIVIHQPSSNIFGMMDQLILLDQGRTMYQGRADSAMTYFAARGHPMPANYNPADWLLQVPMDLKHEELVKSGFFSDNEWTSEDSDDEECVSLDWTQYSNASTTATPTDKKKKKNGPKATLMTQTMEQLRRDGRTLSRDSSGLLLRFLCLGASSILTAISFTHVGIDSLHDPVQFSSHVGAIFFLLLGSTIVMQLVLFDFIEVRDLYIRELRTHQYSIFSFAFSQLVNEFITMFLQTLLVVVLVWWSLGMQGNFWYFLAVLYVLTLVNTSMSFLLGALPEDPRNAKEFIALLILPQLLFSGFFVDPESLPVWISWVSYLMPTFYAFKLVLANEFESCMDYMGMDLHLIECVESFQNAFKDGGIDVADPRVASLYSKDTQILLPEVGLFAGEEDSLEYLTFVNSTVTPTTLFPGKCTVDGSNSIWHKASGPGHCEFITASVQQAQFNENYALEEENREKPVIHVVEALKITYTPGEDLQSIAINQTDLIYPQAFFRELIGEQMDSYGLAEHICETLEDFCPDSWARDGFVDREDCIIKMGALPVTTINEQNQTVLDGNSTSCRSVHAALARKREAHCPHISYLPEEDAKGDFKCHEGYNRNAADYLDDEDRAIMALIAAENNIDTTLQAKSVLTDPTFGDVTDAQQCQGDPNFDELFRNVNLPSNYFCSQFLKSQDATGSNDMVYWAVLVGLYVGIRSLSLLALRTRATKGHLIPPSTKWF